MSESNPVGLGNTMRKASTGIKNFQNSMSGTSKFRAGVIRMNTALKATKNDMDAEEPFIEAEIVSDSEKLAKKQNTVPVYSWFVLGVLVAIRVIYQWQRSIFSYSYGYKGIGMQALNPIYEISSAYPELAA